MSIKIYNAYKIDMTMPEIMGKLKILHQTNFDKVVERLVLIGEERIKKYCDDKGIGLHELLKQESGKLTQSAFNFGYDVVLYFHKTDIYIQFFENELRVDYKEIFDGKLEDFHYQNQSDPWYCFENNMSSDEIKEAEENYVIREKVWSEIFNESYKPSDAGLTYNIYSGDDAWMVGYKFYEKIKSQEKENEIN